MSSGQRMCKACGFLGHNTANCRDMTGQIWGALTVLRLCECRGGGHSYALVRCACGAEKEVRVKHLRSGATRSCGCLRAERLAAKAAMLDTNSLFSVFGEEMTIGEIAAAVNRRPDQIWARMKAGMTAEEAAFGKSQAAAIGRIVAKSHAEPGNEPPPSSGVVAIESPTLAVRVASLESEVAALRTIVDELQARVAS